MLGLIKVKIKEEDKRIESIEEEEIKWGRGWNEK